MDSITFMSYNSTGLDSAKIRFSTDLCEEYDVDFLALQEHFKFVNADKLFRKGFSDFFSYVIPGYREPGQVLGRAKAGLAQPITKKYSMKKRRVKTMSKRVQAQILELPHSRVLWLNTYLPPNPSYNSMMVLSGGNE